MASAAVAQASSSLASQQAVQQQMLQLNKQHSEATARTSLQNQENTQNTKTCTEGGKDAMSMAGELMKGTFK